MIIFWCFLSDEVNFRRDLVGSREGIRVAFDVVVMYSAWWNSTVPTRPWFQSPRASVVQWMFTRPLVLDRSSPRRHLVAQVEQPVGYLAVGLRPRIQSFFFQLNLCSQRTEGRIHTTSVFARSVNDRLTRCERSFSDLSPLTWILYPRLTCSSTCVRIMMIMTRSQTDCRAILYFQNQTTLAVYTWLRMTRRYRPIGSKKLLGSTGPFSA